MKVIWSPEAVAHLARSRRYPCAIDIEVAWTAEAVNDVDAVQVDPYWASRVNALGGHRVLGRRGRGATRARLP